VVADVAFLDSEPGVDFRLAETAIAIGIEGIERRHRLGYCIPFAFGKEAVAVGVVAVEVDLPAGTHAARQEKPRQCEGRYRKESLHCCLLDLLWAEFQNGGFAPGIKCGVSGTPATARRAAPHRCEAGRKRGQVRSRTQGSRTVHRCPL